MNRYESWEPLFRMTVLAMNGKKVDNLKTKLAAWHTRKRSLFGRCLISKTLGLSQIVYSASMLDIPNNYVSVIQSLLFQFLWKNKPDKIKRQVLYQDNCDGGFLVTNVCPCA